MVGAKLWKRILHQGIPSFGGKDKDIALTLQQEIVIAPIIVSTVSHRVKSTGTWDGVKTLPDHNHMQYIAMPFDKFWIEGTWIQESRPSIDHRWGVFAVKHKSLEYDFFTLHTVYSPRDKNTWIFLLGSIRFSIVDGYLNPDTCSFCMSNELYRNTVGNTVKGFDKINTVFRVALETLQLMSCKNVALKPNDNDPKEVRHAIKRHGGKPEDYRYHTLVVRPPGAKAGTPGQDIGILPHHVCRGHFSEYGPEFGKGLLFGKLAGRFYMPPHLKGKEKNGTVEKDYIVGTEKAGINA